MSCLNYEQDQEEAHYHFALGEIVYYIQQYGVDKVMVDVYDMLADECNAKVSQYKLDLKDDEIDKLAEYHGIDSLYETGRVDFARAILRKAQEK